jgi:plastocyanin
MSIWGRKISVKAVVALVFAMIGVAGLLPVRTKGQPREIVLVAKGMAFYTSGTNTANPEITVRPGESIHVVLKNEDRGMTHDFAVPAVKAATDPLDWNQEGGVTFEAPDKPGTYEYICQPHVLMMKGTLKVIRD